LKSQIKSCIIFYAFVCIKNVSTGKKLTLGNISTDETKYILYMLFYHYYIGFMHIYVETVMASKILLHRWCNGWHAGLECGRSWVRAPIGSHQ
jgi:hypothetical protein